MLGAICCEVGLEDKELVQEKDYASISTNTVRKLGEKYGLRAILKSEEKSWKVRNFCWNIKKAKKVKNFIS